MSSTSSTTSVTTTTGATGAGGGNMIRITGLSSGLDIDALVKKMLLDQQTKIDSAKSDLQKTQWKQSAYQTIIKDIKSLQSSYFDVTGSNYILNKNMYAGFDVSSTDPTVAGVTPLSGATAGNYTVKVDKLAQSAQVTGATLNTQVNSPTAANWSGQDIAFSDGSKITLDSGLIDVQSIVNNFNNKIAAQPTLAGKISASYIKDSSGVESIKFSTTSATLQIASTNGTNTTTVVSDLNSIKDKPIVSVSSGTKLTALDSTLTGTINLQFTYNGTQYTASVDNSAAGKNGAATIDDLNSAISSISGGAVTASVDGITGAFTLKTTATGSTSSISVDSGNVLSALKLTAATSNAGSDAVVEITSPGTTTPTTLTESTNNFTLNNISYSLTNAGTTTATVTTDVDTVYNNITGFINKYNSIVDEIQTKLNEKTDSNYYPLTDAKKAAMSATDITNWETKAQQGILRNDDNLTNMLSSLRDAFTAAVNNAGLTFGTYGPNALGIDTSDDITNGDKIMITDSQKLRDAIANHGDEIYKVFANVSTNTGTTSADLTTQYNENGIFKRVNDIITQYVGITGTSLNNAILTKYANNQDDYSIYGFSGTNTLADQIYQQNLVITNLNNDYSTKQEQYYLKFSQLESAMTTLNAQSTAMSSMFGN